MAKLRQAFLTSSASIEISEKCSLPYVYTPTLSPPESDCCIDIFYIVNGTVEVVFNKPPSKKILSGEVFLLNVKRSDYFILSGDSESEVIHVKILPHGVYHDLVMYKNHHENLQILQKGSSNTLPAVIEMIKLLFIINDGENQKNPLLESTVALFFVQVYLTEEQGFLFSSHNSLNHLSALILEIIKKPGHQWRVKDMAKKYNMNTNLFIREFKKVTGFTPLSFLKKVRLNRGKCLLEKTDTPVSVIACECGYNSHASFAHYIKKEFGITPVNIRKNKREGM